MRTGEVPGKEAVKEGITDREQIIGGRTGHLTPGPLASDTGEKGEWRCMYV